MCVDLGVTALRTMKSDCVLAGGVNIIATPFSHMMFSKTGMLSSNGKCHTFDSRANGYVRGEGVGMVVLRRLKDVRSHHCINSGVIVRQDGRSSTLTAPNGPSQEATIRTALVDANLSPNDIDFLECHGTGTPLGDPIEVHGIRNVFDTDRKRPLYLMAVKTNIGHLETAAGIAGLIKLVLCFKKKQLPPNINFENLNPEIDVGKVPIVFPTEAVELEGDTHKAGVSSFGFSGTLAHVVLQTAVTKTKKGSLPEFSNRKQTYFPAETKSKIKTYKTSSSSSSSSVDVMKSIIEFQLDVNREKTMLDYLSTKLKEFSGMESFDESTLLETLLGEAKAQEFVKELSVHLSYHSNMTLDGIVEQLNISTIFE